MLNWADAFVLVIITIYIFDGYRQGFLRLIVDLAGVVVSFFIALKFYSGAAVIFLGWGLSASLTRPIGFLALWIVSQMFFYLVIYLIFKYLPTAFHENKVNKVFGIFAGLAKGLVIVSIFLLLFLTLPVSPSFKTQLSASLIASELVNQTAQIESQLDTVLGQMNNSLSFLGMVSRENDELTKLDFQTNDVQIDEADEVEMLILVNEARAKAGLPGFRQDTLLRNVARAHARDMLQKGYFAHADPNGITPTDRMKMALVQFNVAGENLALAPTVDVAHIGLMNSEKHRENILGTEFKKIGIGVLDAGPFGKMFVQEFTD